MRSARWHPWWLRHVLALAVIGPAIGTIGWAAYGVHGTDDWAAATDAPGFALCGLAGLVSVAGGATWVAARAFARRDGEWYAALAAGCGLAALGLTISLGEAAAVGLGLRPGRVPPGVVAGVAGAWLYFLAVGAGHWHLSRVYPWRSRAAEPAKPDAGPGPARDVGPGHS